MNTKLCGKMDIHDLKTSFTEQDGFDMQNSYGK